MPTNASFIFNPIEFSTPFMAGTIVSKTYCMLIISPRLMPLDEICLYEIIFIPSSSFSPTRHTVLDVPKSIAAINFLIFY